MRRRSARCRPTAGSPRFVRSLVGLDREAAKRAFAEFLEGRTHGGPTRIHRPRDRPPYRAGRDGPEAALRGPFTDFDRNGVEGVFEHADVVHLVEVLRDMMDGPARGR